MSYRMQSAIVFNCFMLIRTNSDPDPALNIATDPDPGSSFLALTNSTRTKKNSLKLESNYGEEEKIILVYKCIFPIKSYELFERDFIMFLAKNKLRTGSETQDFSLKF